MAVNRVVRPVGPRPAPAAAALTPKEVLGILRRHILLIISLTILGFVVGGVAWFLLLEYAPKYTAQTYLKVLPPVQKDPMTVVSPMVAKDIQYGYRATIAATITQQNTLQDLIDMRKVQETEWFQGFGDVQREKDKCIRKAFKDLKKRFRAYPDRDREFVTVSMTCAEKHEAQLIVNEMVEMFLAKQGRTAGEEVTKKLTTLREQKNAVQRELEFAERALDEVSERYGITDLEQFGSRYVQHTYEIRLNDLELERNQMMLQMGQLQAAIGTLEEQATGAIPVQVERLMQTDPVVVALTQQLSLQESALAGRLSKFGEDHRSVRQTRDLIEEIKREIENRKTEVAEQTRQANLRSAQDTMIILTDRLEELEKMRAEAAAKKRDLDLARTQYAIRQAVRDERREMLDTIKAQIESYNIIRKDPETSKVLSMGLAPEPLEVSSPRWEFYFPGGTVLGMMLGVGLAFLIELLNDLVRTPRDVARYLHIPLLGVIPDADEDDEAADVDLLHVVRQAPYSVISESYRRFRTNVKLAGSADSLKVLLVAGGLAGDGATSVAVNLAVTLLAENNKVLLIDANFRRPSLQKVFPKKGGGEPETGSSTVGLSTLLNGKGSYEHTLRANVIEGLDIIETGSPPFNPAELLGGYRMEQLIKDQRNNYDYIIIDAPPVLLLSDAKVLGKLVDGTVLVFNAGTTRRGAAQRTIQEMKAVNAPVIGCVLFAVRVLKGGYYHEQFRSYQKYQKVQLAHSV
ncbi:MAG: polysaccharide biosynthesis tyrosine autokinase [Planctomycetota bacterium]